MTVPLETVISLAIVYREKVERPSTFRTPPLHFIPQHFLLLSLSLTL